MDKQQQPRAKCGHPDTLGFFAGVVCAKCAKKGHRAALGKK